MVLENKEIIYVPAQGIKTFSLREELREIHFFWENKYNGFLFYVNEHTDVLIDDLEYYLQSQELEYSFIDNKDDDILIQAQKVAKKKEYASIKREIKVHQNQIKKHQKEVEFLEKELTKFEETTC